MLYSALPWSYYLTHQNLAHTQLQSHVSCREIRKPPLAPCEAAHPAAMHRQNSSPQAHHQTPDDPQTFEIPQVGQVGHHSIGEQPPPVTPQLHTQSREETWWSNSTVISGYYTVISGYYTHVVSSACSTSCCTAPSQWCAMVPLMNAV